MSYALGVFRCSHDLKSAGQCRWSISIIAARRSDLSQFRGVLFPNLFPNPAAGGPLSRRLIRLSPASRSGPEGRRTSPTRWCAERSPLMPQHEQKGWRPPRIELRDPTVVAARIREHFSREQIDLLIALFSERKPMTSPGNPFTVDRSSSPHEGAADGQQRQDPTDRPAQAWRTPCHADSGRRCRWCYCCRLDGMGNDRPLVDLRPIG